MSTPITERGEPLASLLGRLRRLDANGWCIWTDGTCDDLDDDEAIASLTNQLADLEQGGTGNGETLTGKQTTH